MKKILILLLFCGFWANAQQYHDKGAKFEFATNEGDTITVNTRIPIIDEFGLINYYVDVADLLALNPAPVLEWGNITGTLSDQTDLQGALNDKADQSALTAHTSNGSIHFTQSAISITESQVSDLKDYLRGDVNDTNGSNKLTLGSLEVVGQTTLQNGLNLTSIPVGTSDNILTLNQSTGDVEQRVFSLGDIDIANEAGVSQFPVGLGDQLRIQGSGDTSISFDGITNTINIHSTPGSGGGGAVTSFNGRDGAVVSQAGDYSTAMVNENTNLYFTEPRVRATPLTGLTVTNTPISSTNTFLQALGRLQGQINDRYTKNESNGRYLLNTTDTFTGTLTFDNPSSGGIVTGADSQRLLIGGGSNWSNNNGAYMYLEGLNYGGTGVGGNIYLNPTEGKSVNVTRGLNVINDLTVGGNIAFNSNRITSSVAFGRPTLYLQNYDDPSAGALIRMATTNSEWRIANTYQAATANNLIFRNHTNGVNALELSASSGEAIFGGDITIPNQSWLKDTGGNKIIRTTANGFVQVGDALTGTTTLFGSTSPRYNNGTNTYDLWHAGNLRSNSQNDSRYAIMNATNTGNLTATGTVQGKNLRASAQGDGETLLTFNTERPWLFRQSFTGASTALSLVESNSVGTKNFTIGDLTTPDKVTISSGSGNITTVGAMAASNLSGTNTGDQIAGTGLSGTSTLSITNIAAGSSTSGALRYNGTTKSAGRLYGGSSNPSNTTRLNYDGHLFVSELTSIGDVRANSDKRLKKNIKRIDNALAIVQLLGGYEYDRKDVDLHQAGVIAQEVEEVFPVAVSEDEKGIKSVAYNQLIALLIEAVKEQQIEIENLKTLINEK